MVRATFRNTSVRQHDQTSDATVTASNIATRPFADGRCNLKQAKMDQDPTEQNFVAPLLIRKESRDADMPIPVAADSQDVTQLNEEPLSPRPRFQNFLRASYPFQPTATPSPSTVTLGLNAGDIILVHSIHTNGWADGTLLETGARGWLPTNYCEAYDYAMLRPLLKALTEFWDIIRIGSESNDAVFHSHDYMRGMVAGVRFLLEKSDCLTRESSSTLR